MTDALTPVASCNLATALLEARIAKRSSGALGARMPMLFDPRMPADLYYTLRQIRIFNLVCNIYFLFANACWWVSWFEMMTKISSATRRRFPAWSTVLSAPCYLSGSGDSVVVGCSVSLKRAVQYHHHHHGPMCPLQHIDWPLPAIWIFQNTMKPTPRREWTKHNSVQNTPQGRERTTQSASPVRVVQCAASHTSLSFFQGDRLANST